MDNLPPEILRHIILHVATTYTPKDTGYLVDLPHFYQLRGVSKRFRNIVDDLMDHEKVLPLWATYHRYDPIDLPCHTMRPVELRGYTGPHIQGHIVFSSSHPALQDRLWETTVTLNWEYSTQACIDYWRISGSGWVKNTDVKWALLVRRSATNALCGNYFIYDKTISTRTFVASVHLDQEAWNIYGGKYYDDPQQTGFRSVVRDANGW